MIFGAIAIAGASLTILAMIASPLLKRAVARKEARRSREHGFTLIELMVVIAIIGIIAVFVLPLVGNVGNIRGSGAEASIAAKAYYTNQYPEYSDFRVTCAGSDSQGDGYISCSGRGMKRESDTWANLSPIQCAGGGLAAMQRGASGCKQAGVVIQQQ